MLNIILEELRFTALQYMGGLLEVVTIKVIIVDPHRSEQRFAESWLSKSNDSRFSDLVCTDCLSGCKITGGYC